MIRVGAVNIDTSHPMRFGEVMEEGTDMRYVGVYNDSFRNNKEVDGFIRRFGLKKRCDTLEELADMCDIGFVHGCNWDDHLRCMMPFIERGKPVFVDKPIVGSLKDCDKLQSLADQGAVILGASSVRYALEIQDFLAIPEEERGRIVTVYGTSGVDEFNYGIHVVEGINGLLGSDARRVRYIGCGRCDDKYSESYEIEFADGKNAIYTTFIGTWQPFDFTVMTTKATYSFSVDSSHLYKALLTEIDNFMEGRQSRLVTVPELIASVKIMLAGDASRAQNGTTVALADLKKNDPCFDGGTFWQGYGAAAKPMYADI